MERLKELITQLKEQFDRKVEPSQMLDTARLLEAELKLLSAQPAPAKAVPTKIAVMMPSATKIIAGQVSAGGGQSSIPVTPEARKDLAGQRNGTPPLTAVPPSAAPGQTAPAQPVMTPVSPLNALSPLNAPVSPLNVPVSPLNAPTTPLNVPVSPLNAPVSPLNAPMSPVSAPLNGNGVAAAAAAPATAASIPATATLEAPLQRGQWPFDPLAEKPIDRFTLSQKSREVNDVIGTNGASSLNDKLKSDVSDLKSALNDTPVRDLRKAIGVNDRYVFINQLFRGDEVMYERSLKTINGFRILPEAEYWMERELKVKLGWDENRDATRHFYQLVKRRFS